MINSIGLNEKYSTTRLLTKEKPEIVNNPEDKFETILFLPEGENRKGEGGLRTKGYFKKSYEDKPLISIVTVVYNGEKYLEETIQSVIHQTYDNVEYIIIDGGSTDGTLDIIKKYEDRVDYWASERDSGIYDAWNKALSVIFAPWVSFIGSDDYYEKTAINDYVQYFKTKKYKLDYISSKVDLLNEDGKKIRSIGKKWEWKTFKKFMNVGHVGSIHSIKLFKQYGLYDISYKIAADYEILLRKRELLISGFLDKKTAYMRDGGISHKLINLTFREVFIAKIKTAQRNMLLAYLEMNLAYIKHIIRKIFL